jgi:hypothetical protein
MREQHYYGSADPARRVDRRTAVEDHLDVHGGRCRLPASRRDTLATLGAPRRGDAAEQPAQDVGPMSIRMNHGGLRSSKP